MTSKDSNRPRFPVYGEQSPVLDAMTRNGPNLDAGIRMERNSAWRRSDQQHLIQNGAKALPHVHVDPLNPEMRSPSTPGFGGEHPMKIISWRACENLEIRTTEE